MKKLMALALGMALAMTTVVVAFGQEATKETTKKETTIKKKNKKGSTKTEKTEKKTTEPTHN
jgi:uncharacterized protein HemX